MRDRKSQSTAPLLVTTGPAMQDRPCHSSIAFSPSEIVAHCFADIPLSPNQRKQLDHGREAVSAYLQDQFHMLRNRIVEFYTWCKLAAGEGTGDGNEASLGLLKGESNRWPATETKRA